MCYTHFYPHAATPPVSLAMLYRLDPARQFSSFSLRHQAGGSEKGRGGGVLTSIGGGGGGDDEDPCAADSATPSSSTSSSIIISSSSWVYRSTKYIINSISLSLSNTKFIVYTIFSWMRHGLQKLKYIWVDLVGESSFTIFNHLCIGRPSTCLICPLIFHAILI